ncbi:MAG: GNAT family N-acetyltransferase [Chloroflexi bacterium]|nr:GNAT family N-acetyltransferase [Chloroflexota bacterium]
MGEGLKSTIHITIEPDASANDVQIIEDHINEFNMRVTGDDNWKPVRIFLRDERGSIRGGITADLWGGWLEIGFLWVDEDLRNHGYATQLMHQAEAEARAFGCRNAQVTTHSFQARPFYEKLGYRVIAELEDYPPGHSDFLLRKSLL